MTTQLSPHFTLEELIFSENATRLGIDNSPTKELIDHACQFLVPGLEEVRHLLNNPIKISSGYRSPALNAATPGSSNTSQHTKFEAADILCPSFGPLLSIAKAIIASDIKFDQLIYEYGGWVHVSFSTSPRRSILSKWHNQPYLQGIVLENGTRIL